MMIPNCFAGYMLVAEQRGDPSVLNYTFLALFPIFFGHDGISQSFCNSGDG